MKKILAMILCAVCLLSVFAGCGGDSKKTLSAEALASDLLANAKFTDSLDALDAPVVPLLYGVDAADYKTCSVYCGTGATAEEIAVFEAVDETAAGRILTAAKARVAAQIETYKNYGPEDARMLEGAIVKQSGVFVIVAVCADGASAAKVVDQYI